MALTRTTTPEHPGEPDPESLPVSPAGHIRDLLGFAVSRFARRPGATLGFTLIELVVVVVVLAIIAAIAVPSFLSQRRNGYDARISADLRSTAQELRTHDVDREAFESAFGETSTAAHIKGVDAPAIEGSTPSWNGATSTYLPRVKVSEGTYIEVSVPDPIHPGVTDFCLAGASTRSNYSPTSPGQYDQMLYFDSTLGTVVPFDRLVSTWANGTQTACTNRVDAFNNPGGGELEGGSVGALRDRTNLATNPSFETGSGTVDVATNYFTDPGATKASSNSGWVGGNDSGLTNTVSRSVVDVDYSKSGTAVRTIWTSRVVAQGDVRPQSTQWINFANAHVGERVTVAYKVRTSHAGTVNGPSYCGGGVTNNCAASVRGIARSGSQQIGPDTTAKVWATIEVLEPLNGTTNTPYLSVGGILGTDDGAWADLFEIDFYVGDYQPNREWFSGSYSPDPDLTPAWSGTQNNSTSVLRGVRPSFMGFNNNQASVQSKVWSGSGDSSVRIIPKTSSVDSYSEWAVVTPGRTYRISATVRLDKPLTGSLHGRRLGIMVYGYQGSTLFTNPSSGASAPNTAGEHRVTVTWEAPPDLKRGIDRDGVTYGTGANVRLYNGASAGNGYAWWDDLMIEDITDGIPVDVTYFDGSTPGTRRAIHRWTGTPHASTSTAIAW